MARVHPEKVDKRRNSVGYPVRTCPVCWKKVAGNGNERFRRHQFRSAGYECPATNRHPDTLHMAGYTLDAELEQLPDLTGPQLDMLVEVRRGGVRHYPLTKRRVVEALQGHGLVTAQGEVFMGKRRYAVESAGVPARPRVTMRRAPEYGKDFWVSQNVELVMGCRYLRGRGCRFSVMWLGAAGRARREYQGPIVAGPFGDLIPQATVMSAWPQELLPGIAVRTGDEVDLVLVAEGQSEGDAPTTRVRVTDDDPRGYPDLVVVAARPGRDKQ